MITRATGYLQGNLFLGTSIRLHGDEKGGFSQKSTTGESIKGTNRTWRSNGDSEIHGEYNQHGVGADRFLLVYRPRISTVGWV